MSDPAKTRYCCPACDRDIVNRAADKCLYCGASIPPELQFTEQEIEDNEKALAEKIRDYEKRKRRDKHGDGGDLGWLLDSNLDDWW